MRLTIITPTIGRASLADALASVDEQLLPGDEHLVIGDGPQPVAAKICVGFAAAYCDGPESWSYGTVQRDHGIAMAHGDYLLFLDDDDLFMPDALEIVRAAIAEHPDTPLLFRMSTPHSGVLWRTPVVAEGNVGTPMLVTPRYPDLPRWHDGGNPYTGDHRFIERVTAAHGVVWRKEVICVVR